MRNYIYQKTKAVVSGIGSAMLLLAACLLTGCVNDDGSYDYHELGEISFENIPALTEVIAHADYIKISPRFVSSTEGEIKPGDPNWTVQYRLGPKGMGTMGINPETGEREVFRDITPASGFDLDILADFPTGMYVLWVTLTDNRNGAVFSKQFDISISSATYEGWLVLCNEGSEELARLDMISKLPGNRIQAVHGVCEGLPTLHRATCISAWPQGSNPGDHINMFTQEGSFNLNDETLATEQAMEFNGMFFVSNPGETIIKEQVFPASAWDWQVKYKLCFDNKGNAYIKDDTGSGAAYAWAVNTTHEGTTPEFQVAPVCGFSCVRPWSSSYGHYVLYYDITNKQFRLYDGVDGRQQLNAIPEPGASDVNLFSYKTGKDFVYMQGTRRSNGLVYTILQDPATGKRSIYGINLGGSGYAQELYIPEVSAPNFEQATEFAFDNRFPLLFYAVGNKIYCYNLGTLQTKEVSTGMGSDETITKMKFNLYNCTDYSILSNQSEEFMNQQYRLVVCTCNNDLTSGGKVIFFDVDGVNNNATRAEEYTGFGKIVDIIYRERTIDG